MPLEIPSWDERLPLSSISGFKMFSVHECLTKLSFDCCPDDADGVIQQQAIDLNSELKHNVLAFEAELISKTYVWLDESDPESPAIIAYATIRNSALQRLRAPVQVHSRNEGRNQELHEAPVILLEALAVAREYHSRGIGKLIVSFLLSWFALPDNKSGCRFLLVSAYQEIASYYTEKLGFLPVEPVDADDISTAYYYFDLKWLSDLSN